MFCTRCGNPVSEDDRFCRKCGAPLDVPQMPSEDTPISEGNGRRRQAETVKERRTAPPENEKMKIILPLAILTIVLFSFIIVLIVLLNRPEPEPAPRTSSRVSSVESASIEPATTTTTEATTTTETTTEPPTEADRVLIQDLAYFSKGEVRAEPAAVSENSTSIVYYPAEADGDMYYYVLEWMDYLKKDSKLSYVGSSGSNVLYTSYYDCSDSSIEKKKAKVDGKTKKQDYVLSLVVVNDPNSNAVLSVTANMSKGLNVADMDFRFSGYSMTTTATTTTTTTTKKNDKRTTTTTLKATTVKTTSTTTSTTRRQTETTAQTVLTSAYLQDLSEFSDGTINESDYEYKNDMHTVSYEPSDSGVDITDTVNMWIQSLFDDSDFTYVGIKESDGHIIYYFDYDSGRTNKPKADMDNESGKKEYSLEIDCLCKYSDTITKVTIQACQGINIADMGYRY